MRGARTARERVVLLGLRNAPIILFVLIFVTFGLLSPRFLQPASFVNILNQASYIGILAVGMTFVLLTAGIDLSVGSIMYVSATVAGLLMQTYGLPPGWALLACLATGLAFGAVNAFFITRLNIIPFIVTLSTLIAGRGLALAVTQSQSIVLPNSMFQLSSFRLFGAVPFPIKVFVAVVFVAWVVLRYTPLGRQIYAVGHDLEVAQKAGLSTRGTLASVYLISGFCAALAAFVSISQLGIVNPSFGEGDELDAIAAAVLGGTSLFGGVGSVFPGTVLGTVLIQMVQSGLVFARVDLFIQPLIQALIIFLAVLIDSLRSRHLERLKRRIIRKETGVPAGVAAHD